MGNATLYFSLMSILPPEKQTIFAQAIQRRNSKIKPLNLSWWHKFKMIIKRMYNGLR